MNQQSNPKARSLKPLLLIPVVLIVAKGMSHRHGHWDPAAGGPAFRHGPKRHGRFGQVDPTTGEFRLPPRIAAMLDAWHQRAHDEGRSPETVTV